MLVVNILSLRISFLDYDMALISTPDIAPAPFSYAEYVLSYSVAVVESSLPDTLLLEGMLPLKCIYLLSLTQL